MKRIVILVCFVVALAWHKTALARQGHLQDTVYYLMDTLRTPLNERMWTIANANPHQFYTIKCPCLKSNQLPVFRGNLNKYYNVSLAMAEKFKFISLPDLIDLVRNYDDTDFEKK